MLAELLFQGIEFAIQTVILFGLLWLMIKIQKLDQNFGFSLVRVLGAAALATGLGLILQIVLGQLLGIVLVTYISSPIVFIVLLYRVKKVTGADYVDVLFTVAIARALLFAVNLLLLTSLMGDLRPRVQTPGEFEAAGPPPETRAKGPPAVQPANGSAPAAKPVAAKPMATTGFKANSPAPGEPTNVATQPVPAEPEENLSQYFSVKGVTRNGAHSAVTVQTEARTYTVLLGEAVLMQTSEGPISVRFSDLGEDSATLEINGEPAKFRIP
ncbi:MAG: hypothetical protein WAO02_05675 [Verrucomicrobiia bacterium]